MIPTNYSAPKLCVLASVLAMSAYPLFATDSIVYDPDDGGNAARLDAATLQFGAGNLLVTGVLGSSTGSNLQLLFQSQLNSITTPNGAQFTPAGLNASATVNGVAPYEITAVFSVTERVITARGTPPRILYTLAKTQAASSFVEVYYDPNRNADALQGTGYNDGILILRGTPLVTNPNIGTFVLTSPQPNPLPNFDSFITNEYPGTTSNLAIGGTRFDVSVTYVDANFFPAPLAGDAGHKVKIGDILTFNLGQSMPFDQINPSHKFDGVANAGTGSGPAPSATPRNGAVNGTSGPDLQMQVSAAVTIAAPPSGSPTPTPSPTATPTATPSPGQAKVGVSASKTQVHEGASVTLTFSVKQATHPALTVHYTTAGSATLNTDYTLSGTAGSVVIPANAASATVDLTAIVDTVKEANGESAKIIISDDPAYQVSGTKGKVGITILD